MERLIDTCEYNSRNWGWKDPRVCLTLHCWLDVLESMALLDETRIVSISRSAASVAHSLNKRNRLSTEDGFSLWCAYNRRALDTLQSRTVRTFHFSYERLLAESEPVCRKLFQFLEADLDPSVITTFIDPDLNRSGQRDDKKLNGEAAEISGLLSTLEAESLA